MLNVINLPSSSFKVVLLAFRTIVAYRIKFTEQQQMLEKHTIIVNLNKT